MDLSATEQPRYVRDISTSPRHLRVRIHLSTDPSTEPSTDDGGDGAALDLVDQRMLGGLHVIDLIPTADGAPGGAGSPEPLLPADATHIARDLLDTALQRTGPDGVISRMRASSAPSRPSCSTRGSSRASVTSTPTEGLWESGVHGLRPGTALGPRVVARILESTAEVMTKALEAGGTSFDALYVDVEAPPDSSPASSGPMGARDWSAAAAGPPCSARSWEGALTPTVPAVRPDHDGPADRSGRAGWAEAGTEMC